MKPSYFLKAPGFILLMLILCSFTFLHEEKSGPGNPVVDEGEPPLKNMDQQILGYVNQHRKTMGLRPLQMSIAESRVAARHSFNMATGKVPFGHKDLKKRMEQIADQVGNISATGENVAFGQMDAKEVVDGWLNSPGHRRNIEGDFTLTGIGTAKDQKGMIYFTQIFTK
jgi:uncharacterized protein YkwD